MTSVANSNEVDKESALKCLIPIIQLVMSKCAFSPYKNFKHTKTQTKQQPSIALQPTRSYKVRTRTHYSYATSLFERKKFMGIKFQIQWEKDQHFPILKSGKRSPESNFNNLNNVNRWLCLYSIVLTQLTRKVRYITFRKSYRQLRIHIVASFIAYVNFVIDVVNHLSYCSVRKLITTQSIDYVLKIMMKRSQCQGSLSILQFNL